MSPPTVATIKRLFAKSGNRCAFPKCPFPLVDETSGKVTGRICHIKARQAGGPRYDPEQSDDERHSFKNLVLMCPIHHDVIDSDVESYTVERLLKIKVDHEAAASQASEPTDEVADSLLTVSSNLISGGSLLSSSNQDGGQIAHQINNLLLQPYVSAGLEREIHIRRDAHDLDIFRRSDSILDEDQLERALSTLLADHSYRNNFFTASTEFCYFFSKVQNHYLNTNLVELSLGLAAALNELTNFLADNFFDYPENQTNENIRFCLHPHLNIDRAGRGKFEGMVRYDKYAEELRTVVNKASGAFAVYRRAIKETLIV